MQDKKKIINLILFIILNILYSHIGFAQDIAFKNAMGNAFSLTPNEIKEFRTALAEQKRAASTSPGYSQETSSQRTLLINPSITAKYTPPVVRINNGLLTTITLTDKNGTPWPISQYSIGDNKNFKVIAPKVSHGILIIQGLSSFKETNIVLLLNNFPLPVIVTLISGQKTWDYMDNIRIDSIFGENKNTDKTKTKQAPSYLTEILSGSKTPIGAKKLPLKTCANNTNVWAYKNHLLVKTESILLSPSSIYNLTNTTNNQTVNVYEIQASPYILLSNNNKVSQCIIKEI